MSDVPVLAEKSVRKSDTETLRYTAVVTWEREGGERGGMGDGGLVTWW